MKKLYLTLFIFSASMLFCKSLESEYDNKVFYESEGITYSNEDEKVFKNNEQRFRNNDTEENIFEDIENNPSAAESINSGPGAPGEPVPIDDNIVALFIATLAILIYQKKNLNKMYNK